MASPRGFARYTRTRRLGDDDGHGGHGGIANAKVLAWAYGVAFVVMPMVLVVALALARARVQRARARAVKRIARGDARARLAGRAFADAARAWGRRGGRGDDDDVGRGRGDRRAEGDDDDDDDDDDGGVVFRRVARAFALVAYEDGAATRVEAFVEAAEKRRRRWTSARLGANGAAVVERVGAAASQAAVRESLTTTTATTAPSPSPSTSTSMSTLTLTSMCEEDRALLREEIEVRKLEVGSRMTSNLLNLFSLAQTHAANALRAEGNRIAADGVAETKAQRAERNARYDDEIFHAMTCDALAMGLTTTCAMVSYLAWRQVEAHFSRLTARCGSTRDFTVSFVSAWRLASTIACFTGESTRALVGFITIAAIALTLTRLEVTRRFRAAPMFVSTLVLGVGVGSIGARAVTTLGGDRELWLLAWRTYVMLIACCIASARVLAPRVVHAVSLKWLYYAALGVLAPALVAAAPFAPSMSSMSTTRSIILALTSSISSFPSLFRGASGSPYYYVE